MENLPEKSKALDSFLDYFNNNIELPLQRSIYKVNRRMMRPNKSIELQQAQEEAYGKLMDKKKQKVMD